LTYDENVARVKAALAARRRPGDLDWLWGLFDDPPLPVLRPVAAPPSWCTRAAAPRRRKRRAPKRTRRR
jgi:hypothetical protein